MLLHFKSFLKNGTINLKQLFSLQKLWNISATHCFQFEFIKYIFLNLELFYLVVFRFLDPVL